MNFLVDDFVRPVLLNERLNSLGICKLMNIQDDHFILGFFNDTTSEIIEEKVDVQDELTVQEHMTFALKIFDIPKFTRIYLKDPRDNQWHVGKTLNEDRLTIECEFDQSELKTDYYSKKYLFIRNSLPINDPSFFIKDKINDRKFMFDNKILFERYNNDYRGKTIGIPSILSSNIELKEHQLKVVTTILKDPIQRYLLADEVGLGKTIEACMILKQFIMDFPQNHKTLIIVPPTLINQWKNELISRFHLLDDNNNKNIWLLSYNELDVIEDNISSAKMIIVDEAHNINNLYNTKLYNLLEIYTGNLNKLFLLSATPVYNNEKNYFDMLHLLDPVVYQKNNFDNFQLLLKNRQGLEEAISSLRPENLFNLDMVLDQLTEINHQDKKLNQMINELKDKILLTVDENDEDYQLQLNNLEKYLTETYKLDRRIISTKREDIKYETKRRGVEFIDFEFDYVKKLLDAIDELRISIKLKQLDQKFKNFLLKLFYYSNQRILNNQIVDDLLDDEDIEFDENDLHHLNQIKKSYEIINDNSFLIYEEVEGIINSNYGKSKRYIIFCTSDEDARGLFLFLKEKFPKYVTIIFREKNQFSIDQIDILICKQGAEEGLNLQGKDRALIFFDLPFNANRIEQRIGRVDRFGSEIFEIYVLRNKSNYFELMWSKFLDEDLKIFNESISGLQVFLENEINNLFDNFISEGIDAFHNFFENLTGENNKLEKEKQFLNRRARLRTVNEITDARIDQLIKFDQDYLKIKNSMMSWFCDTLKIGNDDKSIKYIVSLKSDLNHVDDLIQKYSNKNLTLKYAKFDSATDSAIDFFEKNQFNIRSAMPYALLNANDRNVTFKMLEDNEIDLIIVTNNHLRKLKMSNTKVLKDNRVIGKEIIRFIISRHSEISVDKIEKNLIDTIDISASNPHKKIYVTYPYTYDRVTLLNSGLTSSLRLLRSGDSFFEGITNFTDEDDRGRSFTNWRCIKKYKPKTGKADIYFNANLLITPNLNKLSDYLNKLGKISPREISLSLKRKADLFFPPILINLWVDEYEELINEKETLNHLNKIYNKNYDLNLDKKIWKVLTNSKAFQILSKEETWKENIDQVLNTLKKLSLEKENVRKQIEVSLNTLKELSNFQKIQHEARVTQLDEIRARHETLNIEQDLKVNELFMKAIENPDVSCLTFGMTFLSNFLPNSSN